MDGSLKQQSTISANDNLATSWVRWGDLSFKEQCTPHIPLANWLISRHCKQWWKNHPETREYQRTQSSLCGTLWFPQDIKEWTAQTLSIYLDCNPIELINDPETMERIPALTPEIHHQVAEYMKTQEIK